VAAYTWLPPALLHALKSAYDGKAAAGPVVLIAALVLCGAVALLFTLQQRPGSALLRPARHHCNGGV